MVERRRTGSLEAEVLDLLWYNARPLTPGEVNEQLGSKVAYTTVLTVLTRLWQKGLVDRQRLGRGHAYHATVTEADHAAERMREALGRAKDREAVLSRFVDSLPGSETAALRRVLKDLDADR